MKKLAADNHAKALKDQFLQFAQDNGDKIKFLVAKAALASDINCSVCLIKDAYKLANQASQICRDVVPPLQAYPTQTEGQKYQNETLYCDKISQLPPTPAQDNYYARDDLDKYGVSFWNKALAHLNRLKEDLAAGTGSQQDGAIAQDVSFIKQDLAPFANHDPSGDTSLPGLVSGTNCVLPKNW
jgi:hypothetical protein